MFRDDFVWGVASSAYQVEGTDPVNEARKMYLGYFFGSGSF